ncbi:MAG: Tol-Pal system beta propeller repeat protein TolB [Candidatus Korobacteraceae bacterium]
MSSQDMFWSGKKTKKLAVLVTLVLLVSPLLSLRAALPAPQQDWIRTGTGLGVEKVRLAVPEFRQLSVTPQAGSLREVFNQTFWNDLEYAGIFDMVSKSFYPLEAPGQPDQVKLDAWGNPPPNANMLAFGNFNAVGEDLVVQGWLYDVKNTASPQVLGKQYREKATEENARLIAHRFANEIIFRLGGGINGVAESKIFFVSDRSGHKEIWSMDYDGAGQKQLTRLNSIALSPRVSPDGTRVAFSGDRGGFQLMVYSVELGRLVTMPGFGGTNISPGWAPDGSKIIFSSSRNGDPEIYTVDPNGANLRRITAYRGPDVSPVFNAKTGAQVAWVSGRSGLPQVYMMDADGANPQQLTDQGYAVSPAWSPNGQLLAFAWIRRYGPGAPGGQDIYIMDVATKRFVQMTHDAGRNDSPSWSPDGRHIVFQSNRTGSDQVWTMLADGSQQRQLTRSGRNSQPNWSWK